MPKDKPHDQKPRREVWDTMTLPERAIRKAEKRVEELIRHDANRHGGTLRLQHALTQLRSARTLVADHEEALG